MYPILPDEDFRTMMRLLALMIFIAGSVTFGLGFLLARFLS